MRTLTFALAFVTASSLDIGCSRPTDASPEPATASHEPARMTPPPSAEHGAEPAPHVAPAAESAPIEPPQPPFDAAHPAAAGMRWTAPSAFTFQQPATQMRLAEYVVRDRTRAEATMSVFHFPGMGGAIDANVQRWLGQFTQADGRSTLSVAHVTSESVGTIRVTTVDVSGHFEGGTMGGGTGDDYRLLGAIAEAPAGPVFFKLVGPRSVVDANEPQFRALVASFAL